MQDIPGTSLPKGLWTSQEVTCETCGRYIGPVETCPYCRSKHKKNPTIIRVKWGSLVLGVVALLIMWGIATTMEASVVKIGDIQRQNNMGIVKIIGMVNDAPRYYEREYGEIGTISFTVDDGTGIAQIRTYDTAATRMKQLGNIPAYGDNVELTGQVRWQGDKVTITLNSAEQLIIHRAQAVEKPPEIIANADAEIVPSPSSGFEDGGSSWVFLSNPGNASLSNSYHGGSRGAELMNGGTIYRPVNVLAQQTYTLSFFAKATQGATLSACINTSTSGTPVAIMLECDGTWHSYSIVVNTGDVKDIGTACVKFSGSGVVIDDISLKAKFKDGDRVKVTGIVVSSTRMTYAYSLYIRDAAGNKVNIWIPDSIVSMFGVGILDTLNTEKDNITGADTISVEGALKWYDAGKYSHWEVIPATTADIKRVTV